MKLRVLALVAAASLAGCGGGGASAPVVFPCPALTGIFDSTATLVSPPKGDPAVATTIGRISFTVSLALLRTGTVTLAAQPSGPTLTGGPISTDTNGISSVAIPTLQPQTTYHASVNATQIDPATGCRGGATGDLGTFTTR